MGVEPADSPILQYSTMKPNAVEWPAMRDGEYLVVGLETRLPQLCIQCGKETSETPVGFKFERERSFRLQSRRDISTVHAFYCRRHMAARYRINLVAVGGALAGCITGGGAVIAKLSMAAGAFQSLSLMCAICILFAVLWQFGSCHRLTLVRFEGALVYLRGAGDAFLQTLPPVPSEDVAKVTQRT